MKNQPSHVPYLIAFIVGFSLWLIIAMLSGKLEAWDATAYWLVAFPVALLVCAYLGYTYTHRAWRWALVLFEAQAIAMTVRNGELGSLLPLGIIMFAIVALPGMLAATLAARWRHKRDDEA